MTVVVLPAEVGGGIVPVWLWQGVVIGLVTAFGVYLAKRPGELFGWWRRRSKAIEADTRQQDLRRDPTRVTLDELLGRRVDSNSEGLAVELLRAANDLARRLYGETVLDRKRDVTTLGSKIWGKTFQDGDWTAQQSFVEIMGAVDGNQDVALRQTLLDGVARARAGDRARFWVRAPAGAGKTTLLVRTFFEMLGCVESESAESGDEAPGTRPPEQRGPVPLLVQPRNLSQHRQLSDVPESGDWRERFLRAWLDNRSIAVPDELVPALAADLFHALERGDVLLLLDGYDEFHRMGLRDRIWPLLSAPHWIVAERSDEDRKRPVDATLLEPTEVWPPERRRTYLRRRWAGNDRLEPRVDVVLDAIEGARTRWLHTPRQMVFLINVVERASVPVTPTWVRELVRGEARLLNEAFEQALQRLQDLQRLQRVAPDQPELTKAVASARLGQVAAQQDERNTAWIPAAEVDAVWRMLAAMTDVVWSDAPSDGLELRIREPLMSEFFLGYRIAQALALDRAPAVTHTWTETALASASMHLRRKLGGQGAADAVAARLRAPDLARNVSVDDPRARRILGVGLVRLALRLAVDDPQGSGAGLERWVLRDLDLQGVDLSRCTLRGCRFDGSDLSHAQLRHTRFDECSLRRVVFTEADAFGAGFHECRFVEAGADDSTLRVDGFRIGNAVFEGSDVSIERLEAAGADPLVSRYGGAYGRLFSARQQWLLGEAYVDLEVEYDDRIRGALAAATGDATTGVVLVDLMAGGSTARLEVLAGSLEGSGAPLRVLAVDRDTRELQAADVPDGTLRTWSVHLHGGDDDTPGNLTGDLGIAEELAVFPGAPRAAHVIVGKKALHELPRALQPHLLRQSAEHLVQGGRLILFADSPGRMTEEARERLEAARGALLEAGQVDDSLRRILVGELEFGDGDDDVALFCNLWVLLKDWTNENPTELENRYFSGRDEIISWAEATGALDFRDEFTAAYRLNHRKFNEKPLARVAELVESDPDLVRTEAFALQQQIEGIGQPRVHLLRDFTYHHLWGESGATPLGRRLRAREEDTDFDALDPALRALGSIPGMVFDFDVHILEFVRVAESGD